MLAICAAYFGALLFGFLSSALIARWMAATYDASQSFGRCLALMAIVGAPLAVGSVVHLYPHAFLNVLVLVPVLIWCMYLLYRGLPDRARHRAESRHADGFGPDRLPAGRAGQPARDHGGLLGQRHRAVDRDLT